MIGCALLQLLCQPRLQLAEEMPIVSKPTILLVLEANWTSGMQ